jgi:hypothetical protein
MMAIKKIGSVKEMRRRLDDYFRIVLRNQCDTIPKIVGYYLVRQSQEILQSELQRRVTPDLVAKLEEPAGIILKRKQLTKIIDIMTRSVQTLLHDPE